MIEFVIILSNLWVFKRATHSELTGQEKRLEQLNEVIGHHHSVRI